MALANPTQVPAKARGRKSLFPFTRLLDSVENEGKGAALANNVLSKNGQLIKMKSLSLEFTRASKEGIRQQFGFKNSSSQYNDVYLIDSSLSGKYILEMYNLSTEATTYPILAEANEIAVTGTVTFTGASTAVSAAADGAFTTELAVGDYIYLDGEYSDGVRIASITDDDNLVLESAYGGTGGAGSAKSATKHFTTKKVYFRQLGDEAYIASFEATNNGMSFDGTTLTYISNFPTYARYLLLDANRLAVNELASGSISAVMTDFNAGAGSAAKKSYATGMVANGGIETSAGIILMADIGGELHKVIPNNASDGVSAETKLNSFNYTGPGIKNTYQIIMGIDFCYIINKKGIIQINPALGTSRILTDEGNISRRWVDYDVDDAIINYDSADNKIAALVKDIGQYDTLVIADLDEKRISISTQPNSYLESLVNINNQLYGGSSNNGKVFKMFDSFSDRDGDALQMRWILEWDALEGITTEDVLQQILIHGKVNSRSKITAKLYKNGSKEEIFSEEFTGSSSQETQQSGVIGTSGFYVFGLGGRRVEVAEESTDIIKKLKKRANIVTYTLEILEESVYDCRVYDVIIEWKKLTRRFTRDTVQPNTLF